LSKPADKSSDYVSMLETVRDRERSAPLPPLRWALLSNVTQAPLEPFLKQLCYEIGFDADIWIGGYDTALQDATAAECANADVVVVALRLQLLAPPLVDRFVTLTAGDLHTETQRALDYVSAVCAAVRQRSSALLLVHSFETPLNPPLGVLDSRSPAARRTRYAA
jgi:hypothetical protein